jgi:hypothetical protein
MERSQRTVLLFLVGLVLVGAMFMLFTGDKYNWSEWDSSVAYQEKEKEPYGLSAFSVLLKASLDNRLEEINQSGLAALEKYPANTTTYAFVGEQPFYDSIEVARLLTFVQKGGRAFISYNQLTDLVEDTVFQRNICDITSSYYEYHHNTFDSIASCQLYKNDQLSPLVDYALYFKEKKVYYQWRLIPTNQLCKSVAWQKKGQYKDGNINFAAIKYGNGIFLLHTTPIAFTNVHLIRPETRPYTEGVLAELNTEHILYDTYAKTDEARIKATKRAKGVKTMRDSGILSTMLREPALAFAWFLFLGLVGLFLIFGAKREQRMIPVIPPMRNQSLRFVQSLSSLQFRQQNFKSICKQDMRFFLNTVRDRCNIAIPMHANGTVSYSESLIQQIAKSSGFPADRLLDIFKRYEACAVFAPNGEMMTELHQAIEQFIHFKK